MYSRLCYRERWVAWQIVVFVKVSPDFTVCVRNSLYWTAWTVNPRDPTDSWDFKHTLPCPTFYMCAGDWTQVLMHIPLSHLSSLWQVDFQGDISFLYIHTSYPTGNLPSLQCENCHHNQDHYHALNPPFLWWEYLYTDNTIFWSLSLPLPLPPCPLLSSLFFWERAPLWGSDCPRTHYVIQAGMNSEILLPLASWALGLKVSTTTSWLCTPF